MRVGAQPQLTLDERWQIASLKAELAKRDADLRHMNRMYTLVINKINYMRGTDTMDILHEIAETYAMFVQSQCRQPKIIKISEFDLDRVRLRLGMTEKNDNSVVKIFGLDVSIVPKGSKLEIL